MIVSDGEPVVLAEQWIKTLITHSPKELQMNRYSIGGNGTHWTGCESEHIDCKLAMEKELGMVLAVTGHRPDKLGGYSHQTFQTLVAFATKELSEYKRTQDIRYVLSGMALGWDQAVCQACIALGISYTACIPFVGFEKLWPSKAQNYYNHLLDEADALVIVGSNHNGAYQMRNQFMVDNCSTVLALWNGTVGGTKNCVDYAYKVNCRVVNVWYNYIQFLYEETQK